MKSIEKIIIVFVVIILVSIAIYNIAVNVRMTNYLYERNKMCQILTLSLKDQVSENSTCIDYYCYYAPYAAPSPELQNKTTTLCVCECKQRNGTILTVQVLSAIPS